MIKASERHLTLFITPGEVGYFNADVSSDVIEGFIKNRKVDYFDLVGPGTFILDMTFQKVRIRHYSIWFSDIIVDEEIVYRKPDLAIGGIMNVGEFSMNIDIIFRLGDDEIIVEVRPETFSQLAARVGGLSTLLALIGLLLRFYNMKDFNQNVKQWEGLEYIRLSQAVKFAEFGEKDKKENSDVVSEDSYIVKSSDKVEMGELKRRLYMHINEDEPMEKLDLLLTKQTARMNLLFNLKYNMSDQTAGWEEVLAFADIALEKMSHETATNACLTTKNEGGSIMD